MKRGSLRLEQSSNEKGMTIQLHGADLAGMILCADAQWTREKSRPELSVQAVPTSITLRRLVTPIIRANARAVPEVHDICLLDQFASQRRDNGT
jgi:hypothetical protein